MKTKYEKNTCEKKNRLYTPRGVLQFYYEDKAAYNKNEGNAR